MHRRNYTPPRNIQRSSEEIERMLAEVGRPETVRVRLKVDLKGSLGAEVDAFAARTGTTRNAVVREAFSYILQALRLRNNGPLVGNYVEPPLTGLHPR